MFFELCAFEEVAEPVVETHSGLCVALNASPLRAEWVFRGEHFHARFVETLERLALRTLENILFIENIHRTCR